MNSPTDWTRTPCVFSQTYDQYVNNRPLRQTAYQILAALFPLLAAPDKRVLLSVVASAAGAFWERSRPTVSTSYLCAWKRGGFLWRGASACRSDLVLHGTRCTGRPGIVYNGYHGGPGIVPNQDGSVDWWDPGDRGGSGFCFRWHYRRYRGRGSRRWHRGRGSRRWHCRRRHRGRGSRRSGRWDPYLGYSVTELFTNGVWMCMDGIFV